MKFDNKETQFMAKWYGNKIEELIEANRGKTHMELISILSEELENQVKEELSPLTEGYVSEIVGESFDKVNYSALLNYFR